MRKVGRYDSDLIAGLRALLVQRYWERLAPAKTKGALVVLDPNDRTPMVPTFRDPDFVKTFGVGLSKVSDTTLLNLAMGCVHGEDRSEGADPLFR